VNCGGLIFDAPVIEQYTGVLAADEHHVPGAAVDSARRRLRVVGALLTPDLVVAA
jgi:hypothetical protein